MTVGDNNRNKDTPQVLSLRVNAFLMDDSAIFAYLIASPSEVLGISLNVPQ